MEDKKNEITNDIKLNSSPSHSALIEDIFMSPRPNEFTSNNL